MQSSRQFLIPPTEEGLTRAATLLRTGHLVAFPTETVYGLGADATNVEAVLNIFKAKGRPLTDPLIVHVAKAEDADTLIDLHNEEEKRVFHALGQAFWPGPITQIVKASSRIPGPVTANTGFVGIRCPNHKLAVALLERAQVPVAAPSANRFGHVSPTRADHVLADLAEKGVMVLDGESKDSIVQSEPCEFGIESTVVKLDQANRELLIYRQGAVTQAEIVNLFNRIGISWAVRSVQRTVSMHATSAHAVDGEDAISSERVSKQEQLEEEREPSEIEVGQEAPGQAVTHYAPDIPCYMLTGIVNPHTGDSAANIPSAAVATDVSEEAPRNIDVTPQSMQASAVLIDFAGQFAVWQDKVLAYRDLSVVGNASEAARSLFDTLRWAEQIPGGCFVFIAPILSPANTEENINQTADTNVRDMSLGVADRVFRAASGVKAIVYVR